MVVDLSLVRITRLLAYLGNPHRSTYNAIHIAGTNGKGSTIAYLSAILTAARINTGKFTSPHLISYNDCVAINNETYPLPKFENVHRMVKQENVRWSLGCTEFELLTATAYKIFEVEKVLLALVEVGLGGLLDSTNVLEPATSASGGVIACGITKIGIDHESFLGSTLLEIALQKAGIIKLGVPVVVDGTNNPQVLEVMKQKAQENGSILVEANATTTANLEELLTYSKLVGAYQAQNLSVALNILKVLRERNHVYLSENDLKEGISATTWPGRLQTLVDPKTKLLILLDGAHNESAAIELGTYLNTLRTRNEEPEGLIFVVAMTTGKAADKVFLHIFDETADTVYPVGYTSPENMPMVKSYTAEALGAIAKKHVADVRLELDGNLDLIFQKLLQNRLAGDDRNIVVCGSLYLCSDVLRAFAMNASLSLTSA